MMDFDTALAHVFAFEGVDSDDPDDRGGLTRYGISQASYPELDITSLTRADAEAIYRDDYWAPLRCDNMPGPLACPLFDAGVNQGVRSSARMLQSIVGVTIDGFIGPKTTQAVNDYPSITALVAEFTLARVHRYASIAGKRKSQRKYLFGWIRRALAAHKLTRR